MFNTLGKAASDLCLHIFLRVFHSPACVLMISRAVHLHTTIDCPEQDSIFTDCPAYTIVCLQEITAHYCSMWVRYVYSLSFDLRGFFFFALFQRSVSGYASSKLSFIKIYQLYFYFTVLYITCYIYVFVNFYSNEIGKCWYDT